MLIKRTRCRACGAPKVTRPKTGYVYCDYCGTLTDWDLEVAKTAPGAVIPFQYEELTKRLEPEVKAARAAGDKGRYNALQYELYDTYAKLCPAGFSPRVKDPEYRDRFVRYTAATCTVQDFDPEFPALSDAVTATMGKLAWDTSGGSMRVTPASFWPMWSAFRARIDHSMNLNERSGLLARHPDGAPRALLTKMGMSAFAQAWLGYLDPTESAKLLAESGLGGDYVEASPPDLDLRHCGGCGCDLPVAAGATQVVCEACGHVIAIGAREVPCTHCGRPLSWPAGKTILACPGCKNELRAMANPYAT
jgi:uncharacterized Zn finger protein (UPF0148 family)